MTPDISFLLLQQPQFNSEQWTILSAINLQRKEETRDYLSLPRKATSRRNTGVLHPTICAQGEKNPWNRPEGYDLSTQILINLGLCCCMGSGKAWQKSNAATGIECNMKTEGALHYEHRFPASLALIPGHRFYMDSLCSCTTPQQLFSHKPPSRHSNANNCRLAREELALVTCKTWQSITKMGKQCNIIDPCLHIISNFFPRNIYSYTLLHTDCNWAAILRAVRISHIRTPKLSHFMPKKSMKKKKIKAKVQSSFIILLA